MESLIYTVLVVILLIGSGAECTVKPQDTDNWTPLQNQVYTHKGPELGDEATKGKLELLLNIYKKQKDNAFVRRQLWITNILESTLVEPTPADSDKCDQESMRSRNIVLDWNRVWRINIVPLLERSKIKQYRNCEQRWFAALEAAANELGPETSNKAGRLTDSVANSREEQLELLAPIAQMGDDRVAEGVLQFMRREGICPAAKDAFMDAKYFEDTFEDNVGGLCRQVMVKMESPLELYELFSWNGDGLEYFPRVLNDIERRWLLTKRICSRILAVQSQVRERTYTLLAKRGIDCSKS